MKDLQKKLNHIVKSQLNHHRTFSRSMFLLTVNTCWLHSSSNQSMSYNVLLIPFETNQNWFTNPKMIAFTPMHVLVPFCSDCALQLTGSRPDRRSEPSYFAVQYKMHKSRNCRLRTGDAAQNELIANVTPFCSPHRIHVWPWFRFRQNVDSSHWRWHTLASSPPHSHCFISLEMCCTLKLIWLISNSLRYTQASKLTTSSQNDPFLGSHFDQNPDNI